MSKKKNYASRYKLTEAKIKKACALTRKAIHKERIYAALGISGPTYYKYLKIGEELLDSQREPKTADEKLCLKLYVDVEKASIEGEEKDMEIIEEAAPDDWRAAQYRLKVRSSYYNVEKQKPEENKEEEQDEETTKKQGELEGAIDGNG